MLTPHEITRIRETMDERPEVGIAAAIRMGARHLAEDLAPLDDGEERPWVLRIVREARTLDQLSELLIELVTGQEDEATAEEAERLLMSNDELSDDEPLPVSFNDPDVVDGIRPRDAVANDPGVVEGIREAGQ